MFFLFLLVVVLVAVAAAGLLGIGVLSEDRRSQRTGILAISAPVVVVGGVVLLALAAVGLGGVRSDDGEHTPEVPPSTLATVPPRQASIPSARIQPVTDDLPVVDIRAADEDRFSSYRPVSGLVPGGVVRVRAEGFAEFEAGRVEQCVTELGRLPSCRGASPVQFDIDGRADFQFAVRGDFAPGGCRAGEATCLLRLTGNESGRQGSAQTVLVDRLDAGRVTVEPARGVVDGQTVRVTVAGFPPGTSATAVLCAPPAAYDVRHCTAPGPGSTFAIDADGGGRTSIAVAAGRLGTDAAICGPRRHCGIAVVVGPGFVAAPVAPVAFSLGPGVAYDADRVVPGVVVAVVLVALAIGIAIRTDWTKPTEAATPELDRADLRSDQSLDEIFGTDEEIDRRDPIRS